MYNGTAWETVTSVAPPLYTLTSPFTFTPAKTIYAYGSNRHENAVGPTITQMQSEYSPSWTDYTSNLNSLGQGVQLWTVPETATYTIDAYGASGGSTSSQLGGRGAQVRGDFELTQGEIIRIVVGQAGAYGPHTQNYNNANDACASGGGGTYVVRTPYNTNASILVIAGGGGGATQNYWGNYAGIDAASHSTSGNAGAGGTGGCLLYTSPSPRD